jgi:hypothetical protein
VRRPLAIAVIVLSALVVGACSSDASYSRREYIDVLAGGSASAGSPISAKAARCYAADTVDAIGLSALRGTGLPPKKVATPEEISKLLEANGAVAGARLARRLDAEHCFPLAPILQTQIATAFPRLPLADQECLAKGLAADPSVRGRLIDVLAGRSAALLRDAIAATAPDIAKACNIDPANLSS